MDGNIAVIGFGNAEQYYTGGNTDTLTGTWEYSIQHTMIDSSDVTTELFTTDIVTITTDSCSRLMRSSSSSDQSATADCVIDQVNKTITVSNSSDP